MEKILMYGKIKKARLPEGEGRWAGALKDLYQSSP